jgi:hypothetical protein
VTTDRLRYHYAAACARDETLARATLALTLTNEIPVTIVDGVINTIAAAGQQPDLAWDFVQKNLDALTARQGPSFPDEFIPNFMTNFNDDAHAAELAHFGPALATSGGRVMVARAGDDCDLRGPQVARLAGVRCLDQSAITGGRRSRIALIKSGTGGPRCRGE